jgi:hypothetical protein
LSGQCVRDTRIKDAILSISEAIKLSMLPGKLILRRPNLTLGERDLDFVC